MEVVFAAVFALLFGGERLTAQAFFGGVLVIIAMFVIVTKGEEKKVDSIHGN
jgi:drug/metabolite transporter (DMT)-like permease